MARMQLPATNSMRSIQGPTGLRFHVLFKIMLENEGQIVEAWVLLNEDAKAKRYWNARHETDCDMSELNVRENGDRHAPKLAVSSRQKSESKFGADEAGPG